MKIRCYYELNRRFSTIFNYFIIEINLSSNLLFRSDFSERKRTEEAHGPKRESIVQSQAEQ